MLKLLIKKQIAEIFRSYFYNPKTGKTRSKAGTVTLIVLFVLLMAGVFGVSLGFLSYIVCKTAVEANVDWVFFLLMGGMSVLLGTFGTVFNTFAGLYLSKDNDLLLSMPIPPKTIVVARLFAVYFLDWIYTGCVSLPMVVVYWAIKGITVENFICGLMMPLLISVFVMTVSCSLGYLLAEVSKKLKNKSFVTVVIALAGIGAYYFLYFKAQVWIRELVANMAVYGAAFEGKAYVITLIGRSSYEYLPMVCIAAIVFGLFALCYFLMTRSFLRIATASTSARMKTKAVSLQRRSLFSALLSKEFSRFTSSANYMLNCGLGIVVLPALGVALLIKGTSLLDAVASSSLPLPLPVLIAAGLCLALSMIDTAAPSVSLEGKALWQLQAMPVDALTVIKAKLAVQLLLSCVTLAATLVCVSVAMPFTVVEMALVISVTMLFAVVGALFNMLIGLLMPNLTWTNEITPIKQSLGVLLAILGVMVLGAAVGMGYLPLAEYMDGTVYLACIAAVLTALGLFLWHLVKTVGVRAFCKL